MNYQRGLLAPHNVMVDELNIKILDMFPGYIEQRIYYSIDEAKNDNGVGEHILLPEYLNSLCPSDLPMHELKLRKRAIVILLRNLNVPRGLCDGTRMEVMGLYNNLLDCKILSGDRAGQGEWVYSRFQCPCVLLCYNKSF
jgi:hypothetical protein